MDEPATDGEGGNIVKAPTIFGHGLPGHPIYITFSVPEQDLPPFGSG